MKLARHGSFPHSWIICPLTQGSHIQAAHGTMADDNFQQMLGHHEKCASQPPQKCTATWQQFSTWVGFDWYLNLCPVSSWLTSTAVTHLDFRFSQIFLSPVICRMSSYPKNGWARGTPQGQMLILIHVIFTVERQSTHTLVEKWTSPFRLQDFFLHTDRGSVSEKKPCQLVCLSISTRVSFSFLFILFCLSFTTNCKCTSIMRPLTLFFSQLCQRLPRLFRHTFAQVDERSWDWWRDLDSHPCDQGWGRVPCVL